MKTASAFSTSPDTKKALQEAYSNLVRKLEGMPTWMAVHGTVHHAGKTITDILQQLAPDVPFQGGTSCQGVMTEAGFHSNEGVALALFGIRDPEGTYSVGSSDTQAYSRRTGSTAIQDAVAKSGQTAPPALVWITCAPGDEEGIIEGIEEGLFGANVPIIGGSSADNTIEGNWYQITNGQEFKNGLVVTAMYPSKPVRYAFNSSYVPTEKEGIITKVSGRTVFEINHRPAADVYNQWTNGAINDYLDGGNILSISTMNPLGRAALWTSGATFYQLSHPEAVLPNRALSLFTKAEVGEGVFLMEGSARDIVERTDRITSKVLAGISEPENEVAGALIIFCAGCMLAVQDEMMEVSQRFSSALGGRPFLGLHTLGEQGCAILGENKHANLMMSIIVFEN